MSDWLHTQASEKAAHAMQDIPPGLAEWDVLADVAVRAAVSHFLDSLGGPSETMQAAGLTNRGSLAWAMNHRGFPQPVKVLHGIRLWSLDEVREWKANQDQPKNLDGESSGRDDPGATRSGCPGRRNGMAAQGQD